MRTLRPLLALCLAFLWMPLTMHCGLEAVGLWANEADSCCDHAENCTRDACAVVEEGEYVSTAPVVKAPAPALIACPDDFCAQLVLLLAPPTGSMARIEAREHPRDWLGEWHFVRRAARSPRAPSLNA